VTLASGSRDGRHRATTTTTTKGDIRFKIVSRKWLTITRVFAVDFARRDVA